MKRLALGLLTLVLVGIFATGALAQQKPSGEINPPGLGQPPFENSDYEVPAGQPLKGLRICIDPGHGGQVWGKTRGYTGGTRGVESGLTESEANLRVALFLWDLLTQAGARVAMTRTFETRLSEDCLAPEHSDEWKANRRKELHIRDEVAEANGCDYLLSIHHNAIGGKPELNFSAAFYFDQEKYKAQEGKPPPCEHSARAVAESRGLAQAIVESLSKELNLPARPARHGNYHVLRETYLPAVLVECSFMTNPSEDRRLNDLAYNRREAIGIFKGLLSYFSQHPPTAFNRANLAEATAGEKGGAL